MTGNNTRGFTLVEMAIVLVIIAFMIGGVLAPLSTQKEQERRGENQALLEEALEALAGFAVVNGYLPCPDTIGDDGLEDTGGNLGDCGRLTATPNDFYIGRIPWVDLGVNAEFDPWGDGRFVYYAVNGAFVGDPADGTFELDAAGAGTGVIRVHASAADCGTNNNLIADNVPAVIWTSAKTLYIGNADEDENLDPDRCLVFRPYSNVTNQEFDDQMVWLSPNVLFNRMVSAGKLP